MQRANKRSRQIVIKNVKPKSFIPRTIHPTPLKFQVMPKSNPKSAEYKWADAWAHGTVGTTGNTPTLISGVAQGTTPTSRVGARVTYTSITYRANVVCNPTSGDYGVLRIVLVYDRQPNGQLPALSDIFVPNNITGVIDDCSLRNLYNRDRFWIISDECRAVSFYGPLNDTFNVYRKLNTDEVFNSGTDNTINSIQSGAIYACIIPDYSSGQTANKWLAVNFNSRIKYTDS